MCIGVIAVGSLCGTEGKLKINIFSATVSRRRLNSDSLWNRCMFVVRSEIMLIF